jgi:hypothetical protein
VIVLAAGLRVVVAALVGAAIFAVLRWIGHRSRAAYAIVVAGVLLRAAAGLMLFWISYANLAVGKSLHTGDGFWILASDAPAYFQAAINAPEWGFGHVNGTAAAYVRVFALWMHLVGTSPAAGLYLNLLMSVATAALVVAIAPVRNNWREDMPMLVCLAAFSFNPTLVGHGTQPLKDTFMALAVTLGCAGAYVWFKRLHSISVLAAQSTTLWVGLGGVLASVYLVTRIRPYFAFVEWGCFALASLASLMVARQRLRFFSVHAVTLAALWGVMAYGGGPYYKEIMQRTLSATANPAALFSNSASLLRESQAGFARTAGGTNAAALDDAIPGGPRFAEWSLGKGIVLMFVPIAVARPLNWLRFSGGRGLLAFADADTLFVDLTVVLVLVLLVRRRSAARRHLPYAAFAILLALASAGLIAFVVTNLGALLRLRLLFAVPLWMSAVALMQPLAADPAHRDVPSRHSQAV